MSVDERGDREPTDSQAILPAEATVFSDGVVLSGETFCDLTFEIISAVRGHFTDCLFRGCRFVGCNFQRCDFEAVVFEACEFVDCDFSSADLRSVEFARCKICQGKFPNGAIKACAFTECELTGCRFYRQSFEENRLIGCVLESCRFHRATMLHVEFRQCSFRNSSIADCTSLYHVFEGCTFSKSEMNIDSVPLSFGLTRENLISLQLVWQGKKIKRAAEVDLLLEDLLGSLAARGWSIPACVLAVNFSLAQTRDAFRLAFAGISQTVEAGRPLRSDELRFLARVVAILVAGREMPFLPVMTGLDLIIDMAERGEETHEEALRPLFHALREAERAATQAWEQTWQRLLPFRDHSITAEFVFDSNPGVALRPILEELQQILGRADRPALFLGSRNGSYIEVLSVPVTTLIALTVAMGMLVRIVDHMILVRAKWGMLTAPQLPPSVYERALQAPPPASAELAGELRLIAKALVAGHAPLTTENVDALAKQVREIAIIPDADATSQAS